MSIHATNFLKRGYLTFVKGNGNTAAGQQPQPQAPPPQVQPPQQITLIQAILSTSSIAQFGNTFFPLLLRLKAVDIANNESALLSHTQKLLNEYFDTGDEFSVEFGVKLKGDAGALDDSGIQMAIKDGTIMDTALCQAIDRNNMKITRICESRDVADTHNYYLKVLSYFVELFGDWVDHGGNDPNENAQVSDIIDLGAGVNPLRSNPRIIALFRIFPRTINYRTTSVIIRYKDCFDLQVIKGDVETNLIP